MTLDKFGSHISAKKPHLFGYMRIVIQGRYTRNFTNSTVTFKLDNGIEEYNFPLKTGEIDNVYISPQDLEIKINGAQSLSQDELLGKTMQQGDKLSFVSTTLTSKTTSRTTNTVAPFHIELIVKYPINYEHKTRSG